MGFFGLSTSGSKTKSDPLKGVSVKLLHQKQCEICPLNRQAGIKTPNMPPSGSKEPLIYMLGEAPGKDEDIKGKAFVGKAGRLLRSHIPEKYADELRWSNCVRTRPPDNRTPTFVEIEACRPSVEKDIAETKPVAIFGFGNIPLDWAIQQSGITNWRGRRIPVNIAGHKCWFYPMLHPSYIARSARDKDGAELDFVFGLDMRNALAEVEDLPEPVVHTKEDALADIETINGSGGKHDVKRVVSFLRHAAKQKTVGFDYETKNLRPYVKGSKILTVALSTKESTLAFAIHHSGARWTKSQRNEIEDAFEDFLYNSTCVKVAHNLAFEMEWTAYFYGVESLRAGPWGDSMAQGYLLDSRQGCLSLDALCLQYFGINIKPLSAVDTKRLDDEPVDKVLNYNGIDAKYHRLLYLAQRKRLKEEGLTDVYAHHLRRIPTMVLTQLKGVPVSQKEVSSLYEHYMGKIKPIEDEIKGLAIARKFRQRTGHEFSPSSNKDVGVLVHDMLGVDGTGADEKVLKKVDHPIASLILEHRSWSKLLSTYVKPLMPGSPVLFPDGRLHPILATTKTRTWRTSSVDPNEQNFPKRENKEVRRQIKPASSKYKVVSFDYGAIQARNVAMESLDPVLVQSFWDRYDIHADWMQRIAAKYPKWLKEGEKALTGDLRKSYRNKAKNGFVFPLFFGARPAKVAGELGIPLHLAEELWNEFFGLFSALHDWHQRIMYDYERRGYVQGLSGFKRRAPISPNEIINTPIQSDESIIVCDAMIRLSEMGESRFQASLEIHDDLTFIWPEKDIEKNAEVVIGTMLDVPFEWAKVVPIQVEMSVGDDWASTTEKWLEDRGYTDQYASDTWTGRLEPPEKGKDKGNAGPGGNPSKGKNSRQRAALADRDPHSGNWSDGTGWDAVEKLKQFYKRR